jgi:pimeloyl-ACP methyl ester carboxylesterase
MTESLPIVFVPGLLCSARLYAPQITALWPSGPVIVADHRRDETVDAIAARILASAPPRFALAGLSMGGYIAFAMLRQAPERIDRLALLDTSARADTPEQTDARKKLMALAEAGKRLTDVVELLAPRFLHVNRAHDESLKGTVRAMARDTGLEAFLRQERAIMSRPDARPQLAGIRCPTLVLVGEDDPMTPVEAAEEMLALLPDGVGRLERLDRCGHGTFRDQPERTEALLRAFWSADLSR